jgi:hypothetical protein
MTINTHGYRFTTYAGQTFRVQLDFSGSVTVEIREWRPGIPFAEVDGVFKSIDGCNVAPDDPRHIEAFEFWQSGLSERIELDRRLIRGSWFSECPCVHTYWAHWEYNSRALLVFDGVDKATARLVDTTIVFGLRARVLEAAVELALGEEAQVVRP